jgi:uncharacterized repeat protein (TIGR01451 family)
MFGKFTATLFLSFLLGILCGAPVHIYAQSNQQITNSASTQSTTTDPNPENNTDSVTDTLSSTVVVKADLEIKKAASTVQAQAQQTIVYTIDVKNFGPDTATNVKVVDTLPFDLEYVSSTKDGQTTNPEVQTVSNQTKLTFTIAEMNSQATSQILVSTKMKPTNSSSITNTATITAAQEDPNLSNNSATAQVTVIKPTTFETLVRTGGPALFAVASVGAFGGAGFLAYKNGYVSKLRNRIRLR